jgi:hypothetical protein
VLTGGGDVWGITTGGGATAGEAAGGDAVVERADGWAFGECAPPATDGD